MTIRRARERKRLSQAEAAARLGVSRSALNSWENDRAYPRNSVGALEALYGISLDGPPPLISPEVEAAVRADAESPEEAEALLAAMRERKLSRLSERGGAQSA
jgi:transcriptional regulator with XRE-family HTH domain